MTGERMEDSECIGRCAVFKTAVRSSRSMSSGGEGKLEHSTMEARIRGMWSWTWIGNATHCSSCWWTRKTYKWGMRRRWMGRDERRDPEQSVSIIMISLQGPKVTYLVVVPSLHLFLGISAKESASQRTLCLLVFHIQPRLYLPEVIV